MADEERVVETETTGAPAPAPPGGGPAPSMLRRLLRSLPGLGRDLLIILAVWAGIQWWHGRALLPTGAPIPPDLTLTTLDGQTLTAADLSQGAVELHFWATWCGVCRQEFDTLAAIHEELGDGQRLVAVALDSGSPGEVRSFAAERALTYPVAVGDEALQRAFQIHSFPTTYYLGDGRVISRDVGLSTRLGMKMRLWWAGVMG